MARAKKMTYEQISATLRNFTETSRTAHDYAYVAGYYESMIAHLLAEMPARRQEMEVMMINKVAQRLKSS